MSPGLFFLSDFLANFLSHDDGYPELLLERVHRLYSLRTSTEAVVFKSG